MVLSHLLTALTLSHLRPWLKFSLLFTKKFLCYQFGEFGIASANNLLSDIVLYSHDLSAGYCIDLCKEKTLSLSLMEVKGLIGVFRSLLFLYITQITTHDFKYNDICKVICMVPHSHKIYC